MLGDRKRVFTDSGGLGMKIELDPSQIARSFPEEWMMKSDKQKKLENNGCVFAGQEALDNHELDLDKECYCGRPNNSAT